MNILNWLQATEKYAKAQKESCNTMQSSELR